MSGRVTCHSDEHLIFPRQCVCCGAEPKAIHTVRAFRQIDFIFFAVGDESLITVPLCRYCYFVRSFFGPLIGMLVVMAAMATPFILFVAELNPLLKEVYAFVFLAATVLSFLYFRNWNATIMDRLMSGIAAGKLQKDRTFTLWLRREELIPELFYSPTPRRYVNTKSYATYLELEHQQRNSWWAKCLVGLFFVALAAMLFYEITALEAGRGRGDTIPKWALAVYGKWPTCALFALPGLLGIVWGGIQLVATYLPGAKNSNKDCSGEQDTRGAGDRR
jgi:hypothetical protein